MDLKKRGYYFPKFLSNLDSFTFKLSKPFHKIFKQLGEKYHLLLITNSHYAYTQALMTHIFGRSWKKKFPTIIIRSRKPKFYIQDKPFYRMDLKKKDLKGELGLGPPNTISINGNK